MRRELRLLAFCLLPMLLGIGSCGSSRESWPAAKEAFGELDGAMVLIDCVSGRTRTYGHDLVDLRVPPCSSFKTVNVLIGLEEGLVSSPHQRFYQWDGVERSIATWNQDLSLRDAFQASCVPAFQQLARAIGPERMKAWIERLGYGNRDISSGIDVFWLPARGRQTILISPMEQAALMRDIASGVSPLSPKTRDVLRKIMFIRESPLGRMYGKTGSGTNDKGEFILGWFVGFVENGEQVHAFACMAQGPQVTGIKLRGVMEHLLKQEGLL